MISSISQRGETKHERQRSRRVCRAHLVCLNSDDKEILMETGGFSGFNGVCVRSPLVGAN